MYIVVWLRQYNNYKVSDSQTTYLGEQGNIAAYYEIKTKVAHWALKQGIRAGLLGRRKELDNKFMVVSN